MTVNVGGNPPKRKTFPSPPFRDNRRVTISFGAFLNALGILLGALLGLALPRPMSLRAQLVWRSALGAAAIFFGLRLVWVSVNGTLLSVLKQLLLAMLAVMLGNLAGRLLRLQKISNRIGRRAGRVISAPASARPRKSSEALGACAVLFCAAPLGLLGAVVDGLSGYFWLLAVKAVMDGLAMMGLVKLFRWPASVSAFPVFVCLGAVSLACQFYIAPFLDARHLTDSVNAAAGLVACAVALVIFEVRRVELANYLPALAVAPLLAWLLK